LTAALLLNCGGSVFAADDLKDALISGHLGLDARLRFEDVDQENKPKNAIATTLRARIGYETASYFGLSALAEFDIVQHLGPKRFNDTTNGLVDYPTIPDPDMATLNRLQIAYAARLAANPDAPPDLKITVGRQRIIFGDARFIGNAGWRQHEQTFDAVWLSDSSLPDLTLNYAYIEHVNRMFGPHSPVGSFNSNSHLFELIYGGLSPNLNLEGYAYLLDLHEAPTLSTATYGVRATGSFELGSQLKAQLNGAYAWQTDYARNPLPIELSYDLVEAGLQHDDVSVLVGREMLEGNGTIGFQTPLASPHLFQGWAEVFVTKPPDGLIDWYVKGSAGLPPLARIGKLTASLIYHDFAAEHVRTSLGSEWDASLESRLDEHISYGTAFAAYAGGGGLPDKNVFWLYAVYVR